MTNLEKAQKESQEWIEYYQRYMDRVIKARVGLLKIAEILDGLNLEASYGYDSVEIETESVEESRAVLSSILERTSIQEFKKISDPRASSLVWSYAVTYEGIDLRVTPAEPNKDCVAVKKVNSYTSWVCEKRTE